MLKGSRKELPGETKRKITGDRDAAPLGSIRACNNYQPDRAGVSGAFHFGDGLRLRPPL